MSLDDIDTADFYSYERLLTDEERRLPSDVDEDGCFHIVDRTEISCPLCGRESARQSPACRDGCALCALEAVVMTQARTL